MQEVIITQKIKVDDCIAKEIVWLNAVGVSTLGCCCGHGTSQPDAIIKPSSKERARELGYNPYFNANYGFDGEWVIELKSQCKCKNKN